MARPLLVLSSIADEEFGGPEQQMNSEFYLQARREWDERYGDLVLGKRNWQIASASLMLLSLVLAFGIVWQSARTKVIPYIVEVDKLGYAITIPTELNASTTPATIERMKRYEIGEFRALKSQIVISSWGGMRRANPYAFTEQGAAPLSGVLRSRRAIQVKYRDYTSLRPPSPYLGLKCPPRAQTRCSRAEIRRPVQGRFRCDPRIDGSTRAHPAQNRIQQGLTDAATQLLPLTCLLAGL